MATGTIFGVLLLQFGNSVLNILMPAFIIVALFSTMVFLADLEHPCVVDTMAPMQNPPPTWVDLTRRPTSSPAALCRGRGLSPIVVCGPGLTGSSASTSVSSSAFGSPSLVRRPLRPATLCF
jgi:hypothetical protein